MHHVTFLGYLGRYSLLARYVPHVTDLRASLVAIETVRAQADSPCMKASSEAADISGRMQPVSMISVKTLIFT